MISILMPAYIDTTEKQEWINEAIKSIQSQTFKEWELILVDDASPLPINFETPDERVRYFRTTNRSGPSLCRNDAAALASYDCLFPLDADDLLASKDVLSGLFSVWEKNKNKVVYGDLQRMEKVETEWVKGKIFVLPEYEFSKVLDPTGIIPVSAMHSKECHLKAGGWKSELNYGLEDIEYWISAGKAGFCGLKYNGLVLEYRRHQDSRYYNLRNIIRKETEMRQKILKLHEDVYEGRFPMNCCGGGRAYIPPKNGKPKSSEVATISVLNKYPSDQKVWVEYLGKKEGFGIVGKQSGVTYKIEGRGHKFEVFTGDLVPFQKQRSPEGGNSFNINITPPNLPKQIEITSEFNSSTPELAQIIQLDR